MESRVTITRDGEVHVTVTGVTSVERHAITATLDENNQPIAGIVAKRRSYKRKKISRRNRRK